MAIVNRMRVWWVENFNSLRYNCIEHIDPEKDIFDVIGLKN